MSYLNALPDIVIGLSYYAIPISLSITAWQGRHNIWARRVLLLFAAFIISCGTGHLIDAYHISIGQCAAGSPVKIAANISTAFLSVLTAAIIIPFMPLYITALKSPFIIERIKSLVDRVDQ